MNSVLSYQNTETIVYYNACVTNRNQLDYTTIPAEYNQSLDSTLVDFPAKYDICVNRFTMSSQSIPFWACPIQLGQSNPNLTPYGINLSYESASKNVYILPDYFYLEWLNPEIPQPSYQSQGPVITKQIVENGYYWSYDKQDFIDMFNKKMVDALVALRAGFIAAFPADPNPPQQILPYEYRADLDLYVPNPQFPQLSWSEQYNKFQIVVLPELFYYNGSQSNFINIYFNNPLYALLQFPSNANSYNRPAQLVDANKLNVVAADNFIAPSWYKYYNNTSPVNPKLQLVVYSDHNTLGVFSPLQRIVFTSNTLTTKSENIQPGFDPFTFTSPDTVTSLVAQKVLVDFQVDLFSTNDNNRDFIQFNQSINNSRLIGLQNSFEGIKRIDLKAWWSDFNNNMYPIELYAGCSMDIKLALVPRSYIKSNN
jgi:hypothetical protein